MKVAIVQARMGSTRLPGKVLRQLNGPTVLAHVLTRAQAIPGVDRVCCAIPEGRQDDAVAAEAARSGVAISRGPELDVLSRYVIAARDTSASIIVRVTGDCPLLDPAVSGAVLADFLKGGADYVSNVDPRSWPKGLDTEVFSRDALERAAARAAIAYDREHVTPWLLHAADIVRRSVSLSSARCAEWRWTLDYPEDLAFMQAVLAHLPPFPYLPSFEEIRAVVDTRPEIASINANLV